MTKILHKTDELVAKPNQLSYSLTFLEHSNKWSGFNYIIVNISFSRAMIISNKAMKQM